MTEPCTARVTKCGGRLMVGIPHEFKDKFPHDTRVVISKAKISIVKEGFEINITEI